MLLSSYPLDAGRTPVAAPAGLSGTTEKDFLWRCQENSRLGRLAQLLSGDIGQVVGFVVRSPESELFFEREAPKLIEAP